MSCASPALPLVHGLNDFENLLPWLLVAGGLVIFPIILLDCLLYFYRYPPPMAVPPEGTDLSLTTAKHNDAPFPAMYFVRRTLMCPFSWALRRELDRHTLSTRRHAADGGPIDEECTVCLGKLGRSGTWERRLGCGHWFHWDCIDGWLVWACNNCCPTCMRRVLDGRDEAMRVLKHQVG